MRPSRRLGVRISPQVTQSRWAKCGQGDGQSIVSRPDLVPPVASPSPLPPGRDRDGSPRYKRSNARRRPRRTGQIHRRPLRRARGPWCAAWRRARACRLRYGRARCRGRRNRLRLLHHHSGAATITRRSRVSSTRPTSTMVSTPWSWRVRPSCGRGSRHHRRSGLTDRRRPQTDQAQLRGPFPQFAVRTFGVLEWPTCR